MRIGGRGNNPAIAFAFAGKGTYTTLHSAGEPEGGGWRVCAFIEPWGSNLRTACSSGLRAGAQPAQLPSRGESSGRAAAGATALFVGPAKPGSSLRSARRRSDSAVAGLRTREAAARAAQRAANFPCNIIRRLRLLRPRPSKAPVQKTVATRGAKYNKGRHPLSCASARGLRPKSCVRERTSQAPVQCPDLVRPRHANCR